MKTLVFSKKKIFSSFIAGLLVCSFVFAPVSQTLRLQKAEAIPVVEVGANLKTNILTTIESTLTTISSGVTSLSTGSLATKEYVLDTIAWGLINLVLQQMIRSTTQWVNSGFQGSPAFVSNFSGFMMDIADQVAGNLIYGTGLEFLCSPFKVNIRAALDIQYRKSRSAYKTQCRLSSVVSNMQNFLSGDFLSGGWDGWFEVAMNPQSNPYGQMFEAQAAISLGISNAQGSSRAVLNFGSGFLTRQKCEGIGGREVCKTITPGKVIEAQLNSSLAGSQRRLEIADELNELISALFAQLVSTALGGVGGLLGLTTSSGPQGNYFDQMANERTPSTYDGQETLNPFTKVIETQETYLMLQKEIVQILTDASLYKNSVYGNACAISGALTPALAAKLAAATTAKTATETLIPKLRVLKSDLDLIRATSTPASITASLLTKYGVQHRLQVEAKIMSQYSIYITSGEVHSVEENVRLRLQTIPDIKEMVGIFTKNIDTECKVNDGA